MSLWVLVHFRTRFMDPRRTRQVASVGIESKGPIVAIEYMQEEG